MDALTVGVEANHPDGPKANLDLAPQRNLPHVQQVNLPHAPLAGLRAQLRQAALLEAAATAAHQRDPVSRHKRARLSGIC